MTFYYGVRDAKIAAWVGDESYGPTLVDLGAINSVEVVENTTSAKLEGDDRIADSHSKATGATVNVQYGDLSLAAIALMTGETVTGGNKLALGATNRPYFMFCFKADGTNDAGDVHVYVRKCKLEGDLSIINASYGAYVQPRFQLSAIPEDSTDEFILIIENATSTALTYDPDSL